MREIGEYFTLVSLLFGGTMVGLDVAHQEDRSNWNEIRWSKEIATEINGEPEYRLPDGSRVDIQTPTHSYEVEWSEKWPESIGQSVYYGLATNSKPGVYLLLRGRHDEDYLRCLMVCRHLGIDLRVVKTGRRE